MNLPKRWSLAELERDAAQAREAFRAERMDEPLDQYIAFFDTFVPIFRAVLDDVQKLAKSARHRTAPSILTSVSTTRRRAKPQNG